MAEGCEKLVRGLYGWEIEEFRPVFGASLKYEQVRIHECATFPDQIDSLGRRLKGMEPPGKDSHNAVTLGNHCYFPVSLPKNLLPLGDPERYKLDWLVHELTHAWQYQHMGWGYLYKALRAQFRDKALAYDYGGESGLLKSHQKQIPFKKFNPEQQGNITQAYYVRLRLGQDVSAWQAYIDEIQKAV
jgi:hypothetical protein